MTIIKQEDLIQSVADALQYISYYHPLDYIKPRSACLRARAKPGGQDAIAQILTNSRMCAEGASADLPGHRHCHRLPQIGMNVSSGTGP